MNNNFLSRMVLSSIKPHKAALLLFFGFVVFAAGSAQAAVLTWDGDTDGRWDRGENWDPDNGSGLQKISDNTTEIEIAGTTQLEQYLRSHALIRSLTFTSSNIGLTKVGLNSGTIGRNLTFDSSTGTSSITVDASATGHKEVGYYDGAATTGSIILSNYLAIANNMTTSDKLRIRAAITGDKDLSVAGAGTVQFYGDSTYTGDTTITGNNVVFANNSQLAFTIGTNGVNNAVSGSGTVALNGDFLLDLTGAGRTVGDSWQLVDVGTLTETFGGSFSLASTVGSFMETNGVWSISENGAVYEFAENNGVLTVVSSLPAAYWLTGKYGIGWRFRPEQTSEIENWDIDMLVESVQRISNVNHVVINLTDPAGGSQFLEPHSVLSNLHPVFVPNERELFTEALTKFKAAGYKVVAYYASQGPALLKHGVEKAFDAVDDGNGGYTSESMDVWSNYVHSVYGNTTRATYKKAHAEIIFAEYAERYGTLVDGWWFDNGIDNYNAPLQYAIAKAHHPSVVVFSSSDPTTENDAVNGHPVPLQQHPASSDVNLPMVTNVEISDGGYYYTGEHPSLWHLFMAVGEAWNAGDIVWEVDKAADWVARTLNSGGAWTWNLDVTDAESVLREDMVLFLIDVQNKMEENKTNAAPIFAVDPIIGKNGTQDVAYADSIFGSATDGDGDLLSYTKLAGSEWLNVATNGILSGTPVNSNVGLNSFQVGAGDGKGHNTLATLEISVGFPVTTVQFDDLKGDLSGGTINGLPISDPNVSITKATHGNDVVYSMSISSQDLDGGGTFTDSLTWDIRVVGFSNGTYNVDGNDSSVTLGSSVPVGTVNDEFGISNEDARFVDVGESIQFSVENVVLTADAGASAQFDGFSGLWGTTGSYIYGVGSGGLESQVLGANGALTFATKPVLTVTSTVNKERIKNLDGSFTVSSSVPVVTDGSFTVIQDGGQVYPGMTYTRVISPFAYLIETSTNLITASWIPSSVGTDESDFTMVSGPADNADGTETLSFRLNQDLDDANSSMFIRIKGTE